jgi:hypothetical protein
LSGICRQIRRLSRQTRQLSKRVHKPSRLVAAKVEPKEARRFSRLVERSLRQASAAAEGADAGVQPSQWAFIPHSSA